VAVAKFTRTLSTMLQSGVPILDALQVVAKTAGNKIIERAVIRVSESIAEGRPMAEPLADSGVFPNMVIQMIHVGESVGALDTMLEKIADFYDEEVYKKHQNLSKTQATESVEAFLRISKNSLISGSDLLISGFGKFNVKDKNSRRGRNPQTGEELTLEARRVVTFKPSGQNNLFPSEQEPKVRGSHPSALSDLGNIRKIQGSAIGENMQNQLKELDFSAITKCGKFSLHPHSSTISLPHTLVQSVKICGILHPPVVYSDSNNEYTLLTGWRRLRAAKELLGREKCLCLVLSPVPKERDLLLYILEDQFSCGPLDLIEQARFYEICQAILGSESPQYQDFMKALPAGRLTKGSQFLSSLLQYLEPSLFKNIYAGGISEKILKDLASISGDDQRAFAMLIDNLGLGSNMQKKAFTQLYELSRRERRSIQSLLSTPPLSNLLEKREHEDTQKAKDFMAQLEILHRPRLHQEEKAFQDLVKQLALPKNCSLTPSLSFEKDEITLNIRFQNGAQLKCKWQEILDILSGT
ncbi:unnamed protein product, partial [Cyprideis torosa]